MHLAHEQKRAAVLHALWPAENEPTGSPTPDDRDAPWQPPLRFYACRGACCGRLRLRFIPPDGERRAPSYAKMLSPNSRTSSALSITCVIAVLPPDGQIFGCRDGATITRPSVLQYRSNRSLPSAGGREQVPDTREDHVDVGRHLSPQEVARARNRGPGLQAHGVSCSDMAMNRHVPCWGRWKFDSVEVSAPWICRSYSRLAFAP